MLSKFPDRHNICWYPYFCCCHHIIVESMQPSGRSWPDVLQHVWEDHIWSSSFPSLCCLESIDDFIGGESLRQIWCFWEVREGLALLFLYVFCLLAVFLEVAIEKKRMCDFICCYGSCWGDIMPLKTQHWSISLSCGAISELPGYTSHLYNYLVPINCSLKYLIKPVSMALYTSMIHRHARTKYAN